MKWIIIFISLSTTNNVCDSPLPLVKHSDELYDSQEECETAFKNMAFYKKQTPSQLVGFCVGPLKPMFLTPSQLREKIEYPKCP